MVTRPDGLVTIIAFSLVYLKCLLLRLSLGAIMSYFKHILISLKSSDGNKKVKTIHRFSIH